MPRFLNGEYREEEPPPLRCIGRRRVTRTRRERIADAAESNVMDFHVLVSIWTFRQTKSCERTRAATIWIRGSSAALRKAIMQAIKAFPIQSRSSRKLT